MGAPAHGSDDFIRLQTALAGSYSLEREIGRGGMGVVYLARDVALDRLVAIKLLPAALAGDATQRERFLREARTAAKLSHPNIVAIFAVEEVADFVFFVMPFVEGESLGQRIHARGPVPPSELARILREVAWGLAYAHGQGVVHRDVKPDNILLEQGSQRALIADFGIARMAKADGLTGTGEFVGTPEYMSPEQASGEPTDGRSDIYSLGIVAHYALTAKLPFEAESVGALLAKQITQAPPPITFGGSGLSAKLGKAVSRCLVKAPGERFAKAEELADALGGVLDARRTIPMPIRIFIKRVGETGSTALSMGLFAALLGLIAVFFALTDDEQVIFLAFFGSSWAILLCEVIPMAYLLVQARKLLLAGYGQPDLSGAWRDAIESDREERQFERGITASVYERAALWLGGLGLTGAIGGLAAIGRINDADTVYAVGMSIGMLSGMAALALHDSRTNLSGRILARLWAGPFGRIAFQLAGIGLRRSASAGPVTHRHTELALGTAVEALYEALPKATRQQLSELPAVVHGLETEALKMRRQVEALSDAVSRLDPGMPAASVRKDDTKLVARRESLEQDLRAAHDAAKRHLSDAVTAMETIRLDLLRLTAGAGSIATITADLASARGIGEEVTRLLESQREVESLVRKTSTPPPA